MHACGHDVHATWTIGAAMDLLREPAAGDVLIVLQPAEEIGTGARAMLDSGALDGVAAIFGGHVDRRFVVGQVIAEAGPLAASADTFTIQLTGRGAHGARPHEAADPIVAAAAIITALADDRRATHRSCPTGRLHGRQHSRRRRVERHSGNGRPHRHAPRHGRTDSRATGQRADANRD